MSGIPEDSPDKPQRVEDPAEELPDFLFQKVSVTVDQALQSSPSTSSNRHKVGNNQESLCANRNLSRYSLSSGGVHEERDQGGRGRTHAVQRQHGVFKLLLTHDVV